MELCSQVIAFFEEGHGHRSEPSKRRWSSEMANARHFRVSPRFVNDMVILKRESGKLLSKAQANHAEGKSAFFNGSPRDRLGVKGWLTLDEIVAGMSTEHGVSVHRGSVGKSAPARAES